MSQTYTVRPGGLMRCCISTLHEIMEAAEVPPKNGDIVHCKHHNDNGGMIFRAGAWEWNHPLIWNDPSF